MRFSSSSSWALCLSAALACATFAGCEGGTADPEPGEPDAASPDVNVDGGNNRGGDAGSPDVNTDGGDAGSPDVNTDGGEPDVNTDGGEPDVNTDGGEPDVNTDGGTAEPDLPPADPQAACGAATALASGDNSGSNTDAPNNFIAECVGVDAPDAVFSYTMTKADATLIVSAVNTTPGIDFGVSIRTICMDPDSVLDCKDDAPSGWEDVVTAEGLALGDEVFIVVDGYQIDDIGDFTVSIVERTFLAAGATCTPGDLEDICDTSTAETSTFDCAPDGDGTFSCQDPVAAKCAFATTLTHGSATATATLNVTNGTCNSFSDDHEAVFLYTVVGNRVNVTFTGDTNVSAIYARSTCEDVESQTLCKISSTPGEAVLLDVTAGEVYSVFAEIDGGGDVTLTAVESTFNLLNENATCNPDNINEVCDASRDLFCIVPEDEDMGTCNVVGMPNDTCSTATTLDGATGNLTGYLHLANDDYDAELLGNCTTWSSKGSDVVYSVVLNADDEIDLTLNTEADTSLFILDACPPEADSCVAGVDSQSGVGEENLVFTAEEQGTYFVVVDTFSATEQGGNFSLSWAVTSN